MAGVLDGECTLRCIIIALLWLIALIMGGCGVGAGSEQSRRTLTVFAAASLTEVFSEIANVFQESRGENQIVLNFAGSSTLHQQLEHGAQADIFASADELQMDLAVRGGLMGGTPAVFATNTLVVIAREDAPIANLYDLAQPGLQILLANPAVPAGAYAREAIHRMGDHADYGRAFSEGVTGNIVSLEASVRGVLGKVVLGEADAGFVYITDALAAPQGFSIFPLPEAQTPTATYPVAVVRGSEESDLAMGFLEFLLGDEGQSILQSYGFGVPEP